MSKQEAQGKRREGDDPIHVLSGTEAAELPGSEANLSARRRFQHDARISICLRSGQA